MFFFIVVVVFSEKLIKACLDVYKRQIVGLANKKYFVTDCLWPQDLSAASENILLEAVELGLGATWMAIAPFEDRMEYIKNLFSLPDDVIAFNMIILGYPAKEKGFEDRFKPERVHYEKY